MIKKQIMEARCRVDPQTCINTSRRQIDLMIVDNIVEI